MKVRHVMFLALVSLGCLAGCSNSRLFDNNFFGSNEDPETSFNEQMAAFENPIQTPNDQMPSAYDPSSDSPYQSDPNPMSARNDAIYSSGSPDSAYDDSFRSSSMRSSASSSGGGADEVPFAASRKPSAKPQPNMGSL